MENASKPSAAASSEMQIFMNDSLRFNGGSGNEKLITLQVEDIAHFYSLNKITFAVTRQNKEYIIDFPLDKLMEQLDPDKFFRTNRQTIINIESIVKIEPYFQNKVIVHIKPEHKEKILVSKEKWASFKLWLNY